MPGPVRVSGITDLIFKEDGRWCLVDFKTDRTDGNWKPLVEHYAGQLRLYGRAWKELSGEDIAELILFFTDSCAAHSILNADGR